MEFIAKAAGVERSAITEASTIFGDLKMDGEDASDFIRDFSARFALDPASFPFSDYFGGEGVAPQQLLKALLNLVLSLGGGDPHKLAGKRPLTVSYLIRAANEGAWFETA